MLVEGIESTTLEDYPTFVIRKYHRMSVVNNQLSKYLRMLMTTLHICAYLSKVTMSQVNFLFVFTDHECGIVFKSHGFYTLNQHSKLNH